MAETSAHMHAPEQIECFAESEKDWDLFMRRAVEEGLLGPGQVGVSPLRLYQAFLFRRAIRSHTSLLKYSDPVPAVTRDVPDGEIPDNPAMLTKEHW